MNLLINSIRTAILLPLLLLLAACATPRPDQAEVDKAVQLHTDRTLDRSASEDVDSFQDSPFGELVNRAFRGKGESAPHFVNILNHGDDALIARIHLIRSARRTIHFQTFIWGYDEAAQYVLREMVRAARRGVKVKILVDQFGLTGKGKIIEFVATAHLNMEIKIYNPTYEKAKSSMPELAKAVTFKFSQINQRMHNKVLIIDNQIAITGGRNIENKYFDLDPKYTFKDRDILVVGSVVQNMTESFFEYWDFEWSIPLHRLVDVGQRIKGIESENPINELVESPVDPMLAEFDERASDHDYINQAFVAEAFEVEGQVAFFGDHPAKADDSESREVESTALGIRKIISEASESLVMQTPYLVFSKQALRELKRIRKKNPDFEIIASTNSLAAADHLFVYAVGLKQKQKLVKNLKFQIHELKPVPGDVRQMIRPYDNLIAAKGQVGETSEDSDLVETVGPRVGTHAKSFVVDDQVAWIGSHNFDPRSTINTEAVLVVWDDEVAKVLKESILWDTAPQNSWFLAKRQKVPLIGYLGGALETISRALPVFDIWPFYYTTSYEIRPGKVPVPLDDPQFHDHYQAVGPFPGVHLSTKAVRSRLLTAMGGWATPLI
jgi:putative cardiolipin synthase